MKTVREIFSKAFGEVPEGATCHIGSQDCAGIYIGATHYVPFYKRMMDVDKGKWAVSCTEDLYGPDISDRPAESFRGFFGAEYDNCLDAEKESHKLVTQIACWKIGKCNICGDSIQGPNGENYSTCPNCKAPQPEVEK